LPHSKIICATLPPTLDGSSLFSGYDDEIVGTLAGRMIAHDVGRVPTLSRATHRLVGLVSRRDLLKVRASLSDQETSRSQGFA
jgi:CBS domain-containing protein